MAGCGYWRNHYRIEAPTETPGMFGQAVTAWRTVGQVRGSAAIMANEVQDDLGTATRMDADIACAWHPQLLAKCRLIDTSTGEEWNVSSVSDPSAGRRRSLAVKATRIR